MVKPNATTNISVSFPLGSTRVTAVGSSTRSPWNLRWLIPASGVINDKLLNESTQDQHGTLYDEPHPQNLEATKQKRQRPVRNVHRERDIERNVFFGDVRRAQRTVGP